MSRVAFSLYQHLFLFLCLHFSLCECFITIVLFWSPPLCGDFFVLCSFWKKEQKQKKLYLKCSLLEIPRGSVNYQTAESIQMCCVISYSHDCSDI